MNKLLKCLLILSYLSFAINSTSAQGTSNATYIKAGVTIVTGSDNYLDLEMPQGEAAKNILVAYQEEGMKPHDILRSSTYLSAKFMDNTVLKSYTENYELSPELIITVFKYGNHLKAKATGQKEYEFYPKTENTFYAKDVGLQFTFNVNKDRQVESLTLLAGEQESNAPKLKE